MKSIEKLENLGIDNADKAKTIKDLKGQISDLTLAKEKEERTLKIVRTEKAELVQDFDVKVKEKADHTAIVLLKQPHLIPRYVTELQKRKAIELKEGEDMLKMAQMMLNINEKKMESETQALITKEQQLSFRIERQNFEIEKNFNALDKITESISMERQRWGLEQ